MQFSIIKNVANYQINWYILGAYRKRSLTNQILVRKEVKELGEETKVNPEPDQVQPPSNQVLTEREIAVDWLIKELIREKEEFPETALIRFGDPRVVSTALQTTIDIKLGKVVTLVIHIGADGLAQFRAMLEGISYSITEAWNVVSLDSLTLAEVHRYLDARVKPALSEHLRTALLAHRLIWGEAETTGVFYLDFPNS